jgi:site-specific DNA recombinase|tara:strand:+ start:288 stop:1010 length:723 start_codon:yes stop_codon:yes gene_type:complete
MVKQNVITWSYVRCSTSHQDLATQNQQLVDYSKAFGFTIDKNINDFGISGSEFDREGLNQIKDGIENKTFDQLLIYSISRLGRSMIETITLLNELTDNGINVISLKENLDLSTPSGKMISQIFSVLAEYELNNLRQLVSDNLQSKKHSAIKYTKSVFGFDFHNKDMVINEREQKLIRKMFKMYESGKGYTEISNHLNKQGHKIKNGNPFSRSYVRNILSNKQKITDKNSPFFVSRTPNYL